MLTVLIILVTVAVSYQAFNNSSLKDRLLFRVGDIERGEYYRILTSGFLHSDWRHLIFNMISLLFVGRILEKLFQFSPYTAILWYLLLYFGSMIGGSLLSLLLNWKNKQYSALGASGAVSGMLYALAILMPEARIWFIIPLWAYALVFMGVSLFGIQAKRDNIGHDAHLGGAILGLIIACIAFPQALLAHWILALVLVVPPAIFIYLYMTNPLFRVAPGSMFSQMKWPAGNKRRGPRIVHVRPDERKFNIPTRGELQAELDKLLEKVGRRGVSGLTRIEKSRLDELSEKLHGKGGKRDS